MGMKQFLYAIHQHAEKSIDIHCKVSFGFKYIYAKPENVLQTTAMCVNQINLCMCNTHLSLPYQSSKGMQWILKGEKINVFPLISATQGLLSDAEQWPEEWIFPV